MFWGTFTLLSTVAEPVDIPTSRVQVFLFLYILSNFCGLWSVWWQSFWQVWGNSLLWFCFVSLWWLVMVITFSCACWPSVCLLWKNTYSFTSSAHCLIVLFVILILSCVNSLCILDINPLIRCIICKYYLPFRKFSFCFVNGFLCCAKAFKFN